MGKKILAQFPEELPNTETLQPWPGLPPVVVSSLSMEAFKVQLCQKWTMVGRGKTLGDSVLPYTKGLGQLTGPLPASDFASAKYREDPNLPE